MLVLLFLFQSTAVLMKKKKEKNESAPALPWGVLEGHSTKGRTHGREQCFLDSLSLKREEFLPTQASKIES